LREKDHANILKVLKFEEKYLKIEEKENNK
jgi:hypothetical protein